MKYLVFSIFFLILTAFFLPISTIHAQIPGLDPAESVNLQITPETPNPNQNVVATVTSFIENLDSAKITWRVNGTVIKSGRGEKSLNFKVGNVNQTTSLNVTVETNTDVITKNLRIRPADVDIIWESNGYTPPFYKGKALFAHQNKITFTAFPHLTNGSGVEINKGSLIYKWYINGSVVEESSGYGKSSFTYSSPLISRSITLRVEVNSSLSSSIASNTIILNPSGPTILFYKKDPLYGIEFQRALLGTVELKNSKEISVFGAPFFFEVPNPGNTNYRWYLNGSLLPESFSSTEVFRLKEGTSGTSNISLSIENNKKILQFAKSGFSIKFDDISND